MFNDITTLLLRPRVFKDAVDLFVERYRGMGIDAVAGNQHHATTRRTPPLAPRSPLISGPHGRSVGWTWTSLSPAVRCLKRHVAVPRACSRGQS